MSVEKVGGQSTALCRQLEGASTPTQSGCRQEMHAERLFLEEIFALNELMVRRSARLSFD